MDGSKDFLQLDSSIFTKLRAPIWKVIYFQVGSFQNPIESATFEKPGF
jgi:hypothetical protein